MILGVDVEDKESEDEQSETSVQLRQLHEKLRATLPQFPESYRQILSEFVHLENVSEAAPTADAMAIAGDGHEAEHPVAITTKLFAVHGTDEDAAELLSTEEEPTVMTGIIEDSASVEGNAM